MTLLQKGAKQPGTEGREDGCLHQALQSESGTTSGNAGKEERGQKRRAAGVSLQPLHFKNKTKKASREA